MFDINPIYFSGKICQKSLMTKIIYDDIEAVTSLLREKENDLELAAKIGQELLERNQRSDFSIKWTNSLDSDLSPELGWDNITVI